MHVVDTSIDRWMGLPTADRTELIRRLGGRLVHWCVANGSAMTPFRCANTVGHEQCGQRWLVEP